MVLRVIVPPGMDAIFVLPLELCSKLVNEESEDSDEVYVVGREIRITLQSGEQHIECWR